MFKYNRQKLIEDIINLSVKKRNSTSRNNKDKKLESLLKESKSNNKIPKIYKLLVILE